MPKEKINGKSNCATMKIAVALLAMLFFVIAGPGLIGKDLNQAYGGQRGPDRNREVKGPQACSWTAAATFRACLNEIEDDYWIANGNCANLSEAEDRAECFADSKSEYQEAKEQCKDQKEARLELCEELGEAPYDPQINPADFVDFEEILDNGAFTPNPYFPLVPGTVRKYRVTDGDGAVIERIKVEVLNETKQIQGVNCIVVRDRVWEIEENEAGERERSLIEDTFDWYAQDKAGNVWYFGEIARNYEDGELVDVEGSWKAGRDFAKPGILMPADPEPGDLYRQEFALGDAEDMGEVIDYLDPFPVGGEIYGEPPEKKFLQTKDFTPIEPSFFEYKYYAPGVGVVLEEAYEDGEATGERVELVEVTMETP